MLGLRRVVSGRIGSGNVFAKHEGSINTDWWGIFGESSDGNVIVDGRGALIAAESSGLSGEAPNGDVTIYGGEMSVANGTGILVEAGGEVIIESEGPISTLGGVGVAASPGIHAVSTGGSISITNSKPISTTYNQISPAIFATSATDLIIDNSGELSTLQGGGMQLESLSGTIEVTHQNGSITSGGIGAGIRASAESGSILISSSDPYSGISIAGSNEKRTESDGIHARAEGSISVSWAGDIEAKGFGDNAIYANSTSGGISITTSGNVSGFGSNSNGVLLVGSSNLTLNILGGSVGGSDNAGSGVVFTDGADNKITNHGSIASFGPQAIRTMDGNETVENFGAIAGNINLGGGTNSLTNHPGSELRSKSEINIGAGNLFDNSGLFQVGEKGEAAETTVLTGDWTQQS